MKVSLNKIYSELNHEFLLSLGNVYYTVFHSNKSFKRFIYFCEINHLEAGLQVINKEIEKVLGSLPKYKSMNKIELLRCISAIECYNILSRNQTESNVERWLQKLSVKYFSS
jgi:hypothetical protein